MGRRVRKFKCHNCEENFWEVFEHYDKDSLLNHTDNISCSSCDSNDWEITKKTRFSGGRIRNLGYQRTECKECLTEFYIYLAGKNPETLKELITNLKCPDDECSSENIRVGDGALNERKVDRIPNICIDTVSEIE